MGSTDREKRESAAFDDLLLKTQVSDDALVVSGEDIDRYGRPCRRSRLPIDLLFFSLGDVRGKRTLDLGCGDGIWSTLLGLLGAYPVGIEISELYANTAARRAELNGVGERVAILRASAHDLPFPDRTFDLVFGNMILHHLDTLLAGSEIHRVLRPGGRGVFLEPVALSSALRRLRRSSLMSAMVKDAGVSPDEEPLDRAQIARLATPFSQVRVSENQMFSRLDRLLGGEKAVRLLNDLDTRLLGAFPALRRFARYALIEVFK